MLQRDSWQRLSSLCSSILILSPQLYLFRYYVFCSTIIIDFLYLKYSEHFPCTCLSFIAASYMFYNTWVLVFLFMLIVIDFFSCFVQRCTLKFNEMKTTIIATFDLYFMHFSCILHYSFLIISLRNVTLYTNLGLMREKGEEKGNFKRACHRARNWQVNNFNVRKLITFYSVISHCAFVGVHIIVKH